ncbi:MAG: TetR/AcrR family transcriptional regulator [Myxococcales bacterium]|nr:TetR/AcrR family transcriptional regulator [Myxococcales bacterium]
MTAQERKQQEKQLRRRRIQQAARAVFDERGFAKTSIEMIAKSSSLSVGAIYLYFQSKEDLYASLLEESLGQMDETLQTLGAANADLRTVLASLSAWMTQDQESARVFRLLATPGIQSQLSAEVKDAVRDGLGKLRAHLSAAIARGIHTGAYRAISADGAAEQVWATLLGWLEYGDFRRNLGETEIDVATLSIAAAEASLSASSSAMRAAA